MRSELRSALVVRHAMPVIDPAVHRSDWPLSAEGAQAATALGVRIAGLLEGRVIAASGERKAGETAALLAPGRTVVRSDAFSEVDKPWMESGHQEACLAYLDGERPAGWEPHEAVVSRFTEGIGLLDAAHVAVVTHGTAATLVLASLMSHLDSGSFWTGLRMPDAWLVDVSSRTAERVG